MRPPHLEAAAAVAAARRGSKVRLSRAAPPQGGCRVPGGGREGGGRAAGAPWAAPKPGAFPLPRCPALPFPPPHRAAARTALYLPLFSSVISCASQPRRGRRGEAARTPPGTVAAAAARLGAALLSTAAASPSGQRLVPGSRRRGSSRALRGDRAAGTEQDAGFTRAPRARS